MQEQGETRQEIRIRQLTNLPKLIVYSYLDPLTILETISRLSHGERALIKNDANNGSAIYYEGKSRVFDLNDIVSTSCMAHENYFENLFWKRVKIAFVLYERLEFKVSLDSVKSCPRHTSSGNLAYLLSKLPHRFNKRISLNIFPSSQKKFDLNKFFTVLAQRTPNMVLDKLEYNHKNTFAKKLHD